MGNNIVVLKGMGAAGDISFGKLIVFKNDKSDVYRYPINDVYGELERFEEAKKIAIFGLEILYRKSLSEMSQSDAMIFEVHKLMIEDVGFNETVTNIIKEQKVNAEYAVKQTENKFKEDFIAHDFSYATNRIIDIEDVCERLINVLKGTAKEIVNEDEPFIVIAENLYPSEIIQVDKRNLRGVATMMGSINSHTAILAGAMKVPAIVGIGKKLKMEYSGKQAAIDGFEGNIYINPTKEIICRLKSKQKEYANYNSELLKLKGKNSVTVDGTAIDIYANVRNLKEVDDAIENDALGIGLFRSEFLYFGRSTPPGEEEQFEIYKKTAKKMKDKKVVIRTLDMGVDKNVNYLSIPKEENPAMGYRAIRLCFDNIDLFKTQIRAVYRASVYGNIDIMFPMIASLWEVTCIKNIIDEVKLSLDRDGIKYSNNVKIGIMIETPAAALISDELAKHVDFFSIGTNDLNQYILAIDRQNEKLSQFYDPHHRAILMLIELTAKNAKAAGIRVCICGELASDLSLTKKILSMGIDELSVSAGYILSVRKNVMGINLNND